MRYIVGCVHTQHKDQIIFPRNFLLFFYDSLEHVRFLLLLLLIFLFDAINTYDITRVCLCVWVCIFFQQRKRERFSHTYVYISLRTWRFFSIFLHSFPILTSFRISPTLMFSPIIGIRLRFVRVRHKTEKRSKSVLPNYALCAKIRFGALKNCKKKTANTHAEQTPETQLYMSATMRAIIRLDVKWTLRTRISANEQNTGWCVAGDGALKTGGTV